MVLKTARKIVVAVIGGTVLVLGVVMILTPGPGVAAIFAGLAILATEFVFARQLLKRAKEKARVAAVRAGLLRPDKPAVKEEETASPPSSEKGTDHERAAEPAAE